MRPAIHMDLTCESSADEGVDCGSSADVSFPQDRVVTKQDSLEWVGGMLSNARAPVVAYAQLDHDHVGYATEVIHTMFPTFVLRQSLEKSIAIHSRTIASPLEQSEFGTKHAFVPHHLGAVCAHFAQWWHPPGCPHVFYLDTLFDSVSHKSVTFA